MRRLTLLCLAVAAVLLAVAPASALASTAANGPFEDPRLDPGGMFPKAPDEDITSTDIVYIWKTVRYALDVKGCTRIRYADKDPEESGSYYAQCDVDGRYGVEQQVRMTREQLDALGK